MDWIKVKVDIPENYETLTEDFITKVSEITGISACQINDRRDFLEFLETHNPNAHWDYVDEKLDFLKSISTSVEFYLESDKVLSLFREDLVKASSEVFSLEAISIESETVKSEDWESNWKQYFKSFNVGKKFVVIPSWEETPESANPLVIRIDPGNAFGTGQHATTSLCLELLESQDEKLRSGNFLDLGTGSGILTIAAAALGNKNSVIVDISGNAIVTASENIQLNYSEEDFKFSGYVGNILEDDSLVGNILSVAEGGFSVVCANIMTEVLVQIIPLFPKISSDDCTIILSGILDDEIKMSIIEKTLAENPCFSVEKKLIKDGWAAYQVRFKKIF